MMRIFVLGMAALFSAVPNARPDQGGSKGVNLTQLFSHIWQISQADPKPAAGSLYIFLPNGTLLETSCVETYRIATWTVDKEAPRVLRVTEDKQLAFNAEIVSLSDSALQLKQTLVRSREQRNLTLKAVESEFVCPDMPK